MFEQFPYTDMHQLNLDWVIKIAKDFLDKYTHIQELIDSGLESITNLTNEDLELINNTAATITASLNDWYETHSEDIATELNNAIATFQTQASERAAQAIASIPSDYSDFYAEMHDQTLTWQRYLTQEDDAVTVKMGVYGISGNRHPQNLPPDLPVPASAVLIALDRAYSATASTVYFCIRPNGDNYWYYNGSKWLKLASTEYVSNLFGPIIANLAKGKYAKDTPFTFNTIQYAFIADTGVNTVSTDYPDWFVSELIPINPNTLYMVTASARFADHDLFQFLDSSETIIYRKTNTASPLNAIDSELVFSPANARYMRLASVLGASEMGLWTVTDKILSPYWSKYKWTCLGDSLTEPNARSLINYVGYIKNNTDIQVVNLGQGGTGYKRTYAGEGPFTAVIPDIPTDTDIVTIFGTGNDAIYPIGEPSDSGTATLCGAINTTISAIFTRIPTCQLGIITPCPWDSYNPANENNWMAKYSAAIVEICKRWGVPCLDLYHCSNLRPWDATFREYAYTRDDGNGVHPDETGHKIIAPRIQAFLETLLFN